MQSASMTLEAALVLPLFLFAVLNLMSFIEIYRLQSNWNMTLHQSVKELAVVGGVIDKAGDNECIDLIYPYKVKPHVSMVGFSEFWMYSRMRTRAWTGYDVETVHTEEEDMVFITEYGEVYHLTKSCSYLKLSIRAVDKDIVEELEWIPELQKGNKIRTLEELIEYAKKENPRFIQRFSEEPRGIEFTDDEGNKQHGSHLIGWELDENGNAIVFPSIQEMENGELKLLSSWDAYDRAIENNNYLKMTPEEAKLFTESGEDENGNLFGYKIGWPDFFKHVPKNKEGGSLGDKDIPEIEETN